MKALVLAGGYARRLWPLTKDKAKPLLKIAGKPCIDYIIEKLESVGCIDKIFVSTNAKFAPQFKKWASARRFSKPVEIVVEQTKSEDEKLGAVGGINFVVQNKSIAEDLLIVGGDNVIGLDIQEFVEFFDSKKSVVTAVWQTDKLELLRACGVFELDAEERVISIEEKPALPRSNLLGMCCYIYPQSALKLISDYIEKFGTRGGDAPGYLLRYAHERVPVYALKSDSYWFDIGTIENLHEADEFMCTFIDS